MNTIHKPRVSKRPFSRLSDGERHPVVTRNVNVVLADLQAGDLANRAVVARTLPEYGIDTQMPRGHWVEVAMAPECHAGCKVYRDRGGKGVRLAISHTEAYGCDITQAHIDAGVQALPRWEREVLAEEPTIESVAALPSCKSEILREYGLLVTTDEGHGEERAVTAWERSFLSA